ncbi:family 78 glycoside hydrolase [Cryphonectria parasitica EP155]|uniref:Family 78 glycoside hydrolase n=1 Tax=Cryphonectria parasitica (strain ATCC 38755 / EP155) TaxID=660469 RepID=A0A9P4XVR2_CRYP1|nr:family 78 glycoside hydrolase [Cryphonectria parasitica EP155]KAF3761697.1 family 78 glycoside hydrolase [Cryphonectria parasitica EP155]
MLSLVFWPLAALVSHVSAAIPYSDYILAPANRTISPASIYSTSGNVTNAAGVTTSGNGPTILGPGSYITFDYGKNVGGVVSVTAGETSDPSANVTLSYAESSYFISANSSDAMHDGAATVPLYLPVGEGVGTYTVSDDYVRGGFRYLTIGSNSSADIELEAVVTNFTAAPVNDLQAYTGYFHSNDELLNRIWYAGAYTVQLCTLQPQYGDAFDGGLTASGLYTWSQNATLTNGSTCLVDGAKRDRVVWPGDMIISIPTAALTTYDLTSGLNSINSLIIYQQPDGMFPYYGATYETLTHADASFTYHLYTIVDLLYYYIWSGDVDYLEDNWFRVQAGLAWSLSYVDSSGLMDVTSSLDWGRNNMGGHNIEANAALYYTLNLAISAAGVVGDSVSASNWTQYAENIKTAANDLLWVESQGLYIDNDSGDTSLYPQDGNSWAIKANLTQTDSQNQAISSALASRWIYPYGAPAPEGTDVISPFVSGLELEGHLLSGNATRALDLMRLMWGYMLNSEIMTNSTLVEGYSTSGMLNYPSYATSSRISHAHGWSTAPTTLLSTYVAGLHILSAEGTTWLVSPQPGDLTDIEAGFSTGLGVFNISIVANGAGLVNQTTFCTPEGTSGVFQLEDGVGLLYYQDGSSQDFNETGNSASPVRKQRLPSLNHTSESNKYGPAGSQKTKASRGILMTLLLICLHPLCMESKDQVPITAWINLSGWSCAFP